MSTSSHRAKIDLQAVIDEMWDNIDNDNLNFDISELATSSGVGRSTLYDKGDIIKKEA